MDIKIFSLIKTSVICFLLYITLLLYGYNSLLALISYILVAVSLLIIYGFGNNKIITIKLSFRNLLLLWLSFSALSLFLTNIYVMHLWNFNINISIILNTLGSIVINWFLFFLYLFLYLSFSYYCGDVITRKLMKMKITHISEKILIDLTLGFTVLGIILFFIALFFKITVIPVIIFLLLLSLLNIKTNKDIYLSVFELFSKPQRTYTFNMYMFIFYALIFITTALIFSSLFRSYVGGPDAYRDYLNLTKFIAESGRLFSTNVTVLKPFFAEILFVPVFQIGRSSLATPMLYTISTIFLLSLALILKELYHNINKLVLIAIFFIPSIFNFYIYQYKVDIFLLYFSLVLIYLWLRFVKTNNIKYYYIFNIIAGVLLTIKLTSLYTVIPFFMLINLGLLRSPIKSKYKLKNFLGSIILFALPILPWIIFYKIDLYYHYRAFGLGLSQLGSGTPIPLDHGAECSILDHEMNNIYKYKTNFLRFVLLLNYWDIRQ